MPLGIDIEKITREALCARIAELERRVASIEAERANDPEVIRLEEVDRVARACADLKARIKMRGDTSRLDKYIAEVEREIKIARGGA